MSCRVSVIIPAYNSEKHIERCISSIMKCTEEMEIIVINDGSTDGTEKIVKKFSAADSRIRLYSQSNQGVSAARNVGLDVAKGKYIIFSDSDDAIEGEKIKAIVDCAEEQNADIVVFGRVNHYADGKVVSFIPLCEVIEVKENVSYAMEKTILNQKNYGWSSCNKLYKRALISNASLRFIDYKTINSEDRLFNLAYYSDVAKIVFTDQCLFHNYIQESSLSRSSTYSNVVSRNIKSFAYVCDYIKKFPKSHQGQLARYYLISFINNVAVLEVCVNKENFRNMNLSVRRTFEGMKMILKERGLESNLKNEKLYLPSCKSGKYKLLDFLLIRCNMFWIPSAILFVYCKYFAKI